MIKKKGRRIVDFLSFSLVLGSSIIHYHSLLGGVDNTRKGIVVQELLSQTIGGPWNLTFSLTIYIYIYRHTLPLIKIYVLKQIFKEKSEDFTRKAEVGGLYIKVGRRQIYQTLCKK